jgi:DNA invertase Pin-like site-specific DNA recombinase
MKIGYARISDQNQSINPQVSALKKAGCEKIYEETASGAKSERPILSNLFDSLNAGDTLVISKLDRLGRSLKELISIINLLMDKKVDILSINDKIDTQNAHDRHMFTSISEFQRDIANEKTNPGLSSMRARGRSGGKPAGLSKEARKVALAAENLYLENKLSVRQIAQHLGICKATLYAYLRHRKVTIGNYINKEKAPEFETEYTNNTDTSWNPGVD